MKKSRIASPIAAVESPTIRSLPLVELFVETKTELFELMVRSGLRVLDAMLEEDRTALCGPRYVRQAVRNASRAGTVPSEVVARGPVRVPWHGRACAPRGTRSRCRPARRWLKRIRGIGAAASRCWWAWPRQDARSLELLPAGVVSRGTSKRRVSRRFVATTTVPLRAWQATPLDGLALVARLVDGVHIGEPCLVVALGIAADGQKHALGLEEGVAENAAVCQSLLANLQRRGLRTDRTLLVILDGASALHQATRAVCGEAAHIQRCQVHKLRNILDDLPERQRPWVQAVVRRAYQATDSKVATRLITYLTTRLDHEYLSAAGSVREGLEETLTVVTLQLSSRLQRSIATTNAAESLLRRTRHVKRTVKRWRGGQMILRWVAAGVPRGRQGLPTFEGACRHAQTRGRAACTRSAPRPRCLSGARRVESQPSRRRISTAGGTSPAGPSRNRVLRVQSLTCSLRAATRTPLIGMSTRFARGFIGALCRQGPWVSLCTT